MFSKLIFQAFGLQESNPGKLVTDKNTILVHINTRVNLQLTFRESLFVSRVLL